MKRWDKMSKAFTRVGKEIAMAVKAGGPNPDSNPSLRRAIQNGRAVNMPKDKVESAIKKASGQGAAAYEEIVYEGYGPHGVAILVVTATDNPTRTVSNVRVAFNRNGGNMGSSGSVAFQFTKMGVFRLKPEGLDPEALELDLIDFGLEDFGEATGDEGEPQLVVRCAFESFGAMSKALEERGITPISSGSAFVPATLIELDEAAATEVLELVDKLEQDDDVQEVFYNLG
ncbi:putative transcriptional regulatory protein [Deltaproteobacteria bacterium]|nr:putative transcriptional regulatory protein [Deltaproteobacteria bacterium]